MDEYTSTSGGTRSTSPGARSQEAKGPVFTPWGYIQCGGVVLAAGSLLFLVSSGDGWVEADPLIGQILGVVAGALGVMVGLIGVIAEGVRVGTLYARRHDDS